MELVSTCMVVLEAPLSQAGDDGEKVGVHRRSSGVWYEMESKAPSTGEDRMVDRSLP